LKHPPDPRLSLAKYHGSVLASKLKLSERSPDAPPRKRIEKQKQISAAAHPENRI